MATYRQKPESYLGFRLFFVILPGRFNRFDMIEKLRQRIQQLISAYETERQERKRLESELEKTIVQNDTYKKQITELERTIDNLKLADAFKAGNADNTEAKKKIDRLIKEIDKCITLMEG